MIAAFVVFIASSLIVITSLIYGIVDMLRTSKECRRKREVVQHFKKKF